MSLIALILFIVTLSQHWRKKKFISSLAQKTYSFYTWLASRILP